MLSKTKWLIEQQIAICGNENWFIDEVPSVSMNGDEEADADETERTGQNIRRNPAKFRRRLLERVQLLLS